MPELVITKRFTFESHHRLPWHDGKCARDHGHSYVLEVSVKGSVNTKTGVTDSGMVMDFSDLSKPTKQLIAEKLDHYSLNAIMINPTAENIILWIAEQLDVSLPGLMRLRLWETETSFVEWSR